MTLIKSISGIRGTIGGTPGGALTPIDIVKFTTAYAATLPFRKPAPNGTRYKIVVGKDAILDRLVHNALRIELKGESLRKLLSNVKPALF